MKKVIVSVLTFAILITMLLTINVSASNIKAQRTSAKIMLDGKSVSCKGFSILDNNYYNLRDLAKIFNGTTNQFDVVWNEKKNSVEIITGQSYKDINEKQLPNQYYYSSYKATLTSSDILIDGNLTNVSAYTIEGNNYFKLRDLADVLHFDVEWDEGNNSILLLTQLTQNAYRSPISYLTYSNTRSSNFGRWSSPLMSYEIKNDNHTISVVDVTDVVNVDTYDMNYNLLSTKTIDFELPRFGCFFSGVKYNYIAFGQENKEESDSKEVIRIVRYNKNFDRIDSVSVNNCYTIIPFESCGRMAENGNELVFHTSRTRYKTEDGNNHQSQLTVIVDTSSMKVINDLGEFQNNHVSHSFDQYVMFDGNSPVLVDHGDAYPRSVVLSKGNGAEYKTVDLFKIPGAIGANCTGVSVGGFELSSDNYIVAMNSIDHSLVSEYTSFKMKGLETDQRDIIICTLPKNNITNSKAKQITLAKYVGSDKIASIPQLVKITDDKLMVLWQEFLITDKTPGDLKYVFIDKNGNPTSEIMSKEHFKLSTCKPIVVENSVVWYYNQNKYRFFNVILLD